MVNEIICFQERIDLPVFLAEAVKFEAPGAPVPASHDEYIFLFGNGLFEQIGDILFSISIRFIQLRTNALSPAGYTCQQQQEKKTSFHLKRLKLIYNNV